MKQKIILTVLTIIIIVIPNTTQRGDIKYNFIDTDGNGNSELLIISGSGTVKKYSPGIYNGVKVIFVCKDITDIDPYAFADLRSLKLLVVPYSACRHDMDLPLFTDLLFIEDGEYAEFVNLYV